MSRAGAILGVSGPLAAEELHQFAEVQRADIASLKCLHLCPGSVSYEER